jgi:enoyl-CoA hydratase/carnithine racemase
VLLTARAGPNVRRRENGVFLVRLNRPKTKNAYNQQLYDEICLSLMAAEVDDRVCMAVVTGSGNFFSSGADLNQASDPQAQAYKSPDNAPVYMQYLPRFKKPLIAAVNGPSIGIATTSLSHFDVVYMAEGAYLWTPFARAGLYPEFASSVMFPKLMGDHVAMEMLLLSKKLSSQEAFNCGFVNELFPAGDEFEPAVLARIEEQLAMSGPPGEYQTTTFMEYKNLIKKDDHFEMLTQAFKEENALQAQRVKDGTAAKARDYLAKMDPKVRTNLCRVQPVLSPRGGAPPLPVA